MSITLHLRFAVVAVALLCVVGGCKGDRTPPSDDSALLSDLAQAEQANAGPALQDTALGATKAPSVPRSSARGSSSTSSTPQVTPPAPASQPVTTPAAAPARQAALDAGTAIALTSGPRMCTSTLKPGDKFIATLPNDVTGTNGFRFPAGSKAVIEVLTITRHEHADSATIDFRVRSISAGGVTYAVVGDVRPVSPLERIQRESKGGDKSKVIGGAIAGAVLGQVLGKDTKSTVIGAAAGAAAGTVAAQSTRKYEGCLPAASALKLTLTEPLYIT
jgi:outer membrane lipoprotein SlyB